MRPLAILTGFLLGTAASIAFGLTVVGFLFAVWAPEYPQVRAEIEPLLTAAGLFLILTATSALSFIGLLRERPWRWVAQLAMWATAVGTVVYFLP